MGTKKLAADHDAPAKRQTACTWPLRGTDPLELKALRERIKRGAGTVRFVYREHEKAREILITNYDVEGRQDLVGVYNSKVTTAMLRQDLYGEDAADIRFAEWGERRAA